MRQFWNTIVQIVRLRLNRILVGIQRLSSPAYLFQVFLRRVGSFFNRLLDIKPKHRKDYYTIFGWMVSRRLVNLLLILAGIGCIFYLSVTRPVGNSSESGTGSSVYKYSSIPLRFVDGEVKIKAKGGYIAYEGHVSKGYANGTGKLYDKEGGLVYDGEFAQNKYSGTGTLYYPSGQKEYTGEFSNNLFEGTGTQYRESGARLYEGAFSEGMKEGEGTLYGASDNQVFKGNFHLDEIIYTQLLQKNAEELGSLYTGSQIIYQNGDTSENAVVLSDVDVIYDSKDTSTSVDDTMKSDVLCVAKSSFVYGSQKIDTIEGLTEVLGEPEYEGNSYMTFLEAVGISWLQNHGKAMEIDTGLNIESVFDEVNTVKSYEKETSLYLHTYEVGEQTYTFVSQDKTGSFFMYEIE